MSRPVFTTNAMKARTHLIISISLLFSPLALRAAEQQKWQTNWVEFGKALTPIMEKSGVTEQDINRIFDGKQVEWEGEVTKVSQPDDKQEFGSIVVKMEPIRLTKSGVSVDLDEIKLTPQNEREWGSWADIRDGTRVSFRTKLKSPELPGMAVVFMIFEPGPNAQVVRVIVMTEGATMLRSISTDGKKQK